MPPLVLDILKYGFLAYLAFDLARNLTTTHNKRLFKVTLCGSPKFMILYGLLNFFVLAAVFGVGTLAYYYIPWPSIPLPSGIHEPLSQFSWLQLLASKENPEAGGNLMVSGAMQVPILGIPFFMLLLLNLPRLARYEEDAFRRGTKDWKDAILRSLKFGFMHCLVGVPLAYGLGLSVGGMWFTWHYFKGGVRRSTTVHALYNAALVTFLAGFLAYSMVTAKPSPKPTKDAKSVGQTAPIPASKTR
jgi:hypothetical protein